MKYLKQILLAVAMLLILIGCFAFSVLATGYDYGAMDGPSAGDYPLIDPGVSEGPSAGDGGVVEPQVTEPVPDYPVMPDIDGPSGPLGLDFSIIEINPETEELGESYSFSALVPSYGLDHIASEGVVFDNDILGKCKFVWREVMNLPSEVIVLQTDVEGEFGSSGFCLLYDPDSMNPLAFEDSLISSKQYYAIFLCDNGLHTYGDPERVRSATCTESGLYLEVCTLCGYKHQYSTSPLGHKRDFWGNCIRCGDGGIDDTINNIGGSIQDGWNNLFGGSGDSSSGADPNEGGESGSDPLSDLGKWLGELGGKIKNFFGSSSGSDEKPWYEDLLDKIKGGSSSSGNSFADGVRSLVSLLSLGLVCLVVVILWPILKPIMEFISDGIKAAIKAVSSGVKSLSKKVKNKKKS